uniref:Ionotropic glutamate receptor C-terminal domain-containing protein n=1 Tax=Fagus sylvatica TaxID=28930 RepID=A0A2N9EYT1_FAGSY
MTSQLGLIRMLMWHHGGMIRGTWHVLAACWRALDGCQHIQARGEHMKTREKAGRHSAGAWKRVTRKVFISTRLGRLRVDGKVVTPAACGKEGLLSDGVWKSVTALMMKISPRIDRSSDDLHRSGVCFPSLKRLRVDRKVVTSAARGKEGETVVSNLTRFMVIIWVFVVLILTQSYTASLASLLTVQQLQPTLTDVNQLIKSREYVGYEEGSYVLGILKEMKFDETKLKAFKSPEECDELLSRGSANGGIAAAIDDIPCMKLLLGKYCSKKTAHQEKSDTESVHVIGASDASPNNNYPPSPSSFSISMEPHTAFSDSGTPPREYCHPNPNGHTFQLAQAIKLIDHPNQEGPRIPEIAHANC